MSEKREGERQTNRKYFIASFRSVDTLSRLVFALQLLVLVFGKL